MHDRSRDADLKGCMGENPEGEGESIITKGKVEADAGDQGGGSSISRTTRYRLRIKTKVKGDAKMSIQPLVPLNQHLGIF